MSNEVAGADVVKLVGVTVVTIFNLRELAAAELVVRASDGPPSMSSDELARRIAAQKD